MSSLSRAVFMSLLLFCTSVLSVGAVVLRKEKWGDLTVYLGSEENCHYDSNDDFIKRAKGAFDSLSSLGLSKNQKPKAITLLRTGDANRCIYASSAKGSGHVMGNPHIQNQVQTVLQGISADPEREHPNFVRCGEIMVISEWFREHGAGQQHLPPSKLIVTVKEEGVEAPCVQNLAGQARGGTFGCREFLTQMGFTNTQVIDHEILPLLLRRNFCELKKVPKVAGATPGHSIAHISRTKRRATNRGAKYRRGVFLSNGRSERQA